MQKRLSKSRQLLFLYEVATYSMGKLAISTVVFLTLFSLPFSGLAGLLPMVVGQSSAFIRKTPQKIAKKQICLQLSLPISLNCDDCHYKTEADQK